MISFNQFCITEAGKAGEKAGTLELVRVEYDFARSYVEAAMGETFTVIKDFKKNFYHAQGLAKLGWTKRKDMPRITSSDVNDLKNRLQQGFLDVNAPFAPGTNKNNLFPERLAGEAAKQWLQNGLPTFDGNSNDDRVKADFRHVAVGDLKPIQKQIYFDKAVEIIAKGNIAATKSFLQNQTIYVISSDNYIIDGHHRFAAAVLLDPRMKVQAISIDLPIKKLLPLALAYGDAVGNRRNA